jgi:hypothetical protein
MKYFLDTEFLEGPQKTWFGKSKPTIDLISIGIVCEDGREYYAVSKDFNLKQAWKDDWIQENVLLPIYKDWVHGDMRNRFSFSYSTMKRLLKYSGKSNKQIAFEIKEFVGTKETIGNWEEVKNKMNTQFYAYYADYDWVVFCWLFGRMIDLPKGFPMYCRDLKQMLDEKQEYYNNIHLSKVRRKGYNRLEPINIKTLENYPKQINEHNALADAKWNFELYKFLKTL